MRPLCSGVLWLPLTVAWWFGPNPGKPVRWQNTVCWVIVLSVLLCSRPSAALWEATVWKAAFSSGSSRPPRLKPDTLAENVCIYIFLFLFIDGEKPLPVLFIVPGPTIHLMLPLHISSSHPFLPQFILIYFSPVWLLRRVNRGRGRRRETRVRGRIKYECGWGQALRFCRHVMLMVSRSGSILHPGDSPSHPSP